ncbi:recombinase family protein [Rhodobacter sp. HX-7-19]|uniref:Recombinase family protein n=1 Tax=Paragemmobacter kunshanensis TaxID=2583234 RepID=A0A6M1U908_9RHOB|nr:recombinase family protein [Rhodobacter kunshanensis]NGQ93155.1 recombinase family protein [Rhodobacter kunshanensis]
MTKPVIRCAVYTRKSSEDGLDQDFNSLDAQHEACAAYIASQRHEGWKMLPARYDDGGVSGGTLERPALQRLLADIGAGRIDMVVVYKIDRLTRSLADFAKLVERLEAANCSFVSVTQAFNTSSSMGRLTLNVLLSFAQFEREVTAERIRDKIAASKKKGLWMGGLPPLGYDPHPDRQRRELVVNPREAETVRRLFALYADHRNLRRTEEAAAREGLRSKRHHFASGRQQGGGALSRGQIHKILTNPVYLGRIRHRDRCWPGSHPAIVTEVLWTEVQDLLQAASARRRGTRAGALAGHEAPLKGKLRDETGDPLTPTHTQRRGRKLRYYVSNRLISGGRDASGWRLPAGALEAAVANAIAVHLAASAARHAVLAQPDAAEAAPASAAIALLAQSIRREECRAGAVLIDTIALARGRLDIDLDRDAVAAAAGLPAGRLHPALLRIEAPFACRRRGVETRIIAGDPLPAPDATLIRALRNAHRWAEALKSGTALGRLAAAEKVAERYLARILHLAGLSPRIQAAILNGTQPAELTLERLVKVQLPLDWTAQERLLGFAG